MRHPSKYTLAGGIEVTLYEMHNAPRAMVEAIAEKHGPVVAAELLGMWSEHVRTTTPEFGVSAAEKWARYHRILAACRMSLQNLQPKEVSA